MTSAKLAPAKTTGALHDVRENARKLSILYTIEVEIARLIGRWLPAVPWLEEKLLLGRLLYEDAEHAALIEERLVELRVAEARLPDFRARTAPALKLLETVTDPDQFLAGLFRVVKPALIADYRRHIDSCPPFVDEPSKRFLLRALAEEEEHVGRGLSLLARRGIGWLDLGGIESQVRAGLWRLDDKEGGFITGDFRRA